VREPKDMSYRRKGCHPRHQRTRKVENVLVLQGGGSLGAFGCGVFKGLTKSEFRPDIVAGTFGQGIFFPPLPLTHTTIYIMNNSKHALTINLITS
jgi:hypothetical protein